MLEWYAKEERHLKNRRIMEQHWANLRNEAASGVEGMSNDTPQKVHPGVAFDPKTPRSPSCSPPLVAGTAKKQSPARKLDSPRHAMKPKEPKPEPAQQLNFSDLGVAAGAEVATVESPRRLTIYSRGRPKPQEPAPFARDDHHQRKLHEAMKNMQINEECKAKAWIPHRNGGVQNPGGLFVACAAPLPPAMAAADAVVSPDASPIKSKRNAFQSPPKNRPKALVEAARSAINHVWKEEAKNDRAGRHRARSAGTRRQPAVTPRAPMPPAATAAPAEQSSLRKKLALPFGKSKRSVRTFYHNDHNGKLMFTGINALMDQPGIGC